MEDHYANGKGSSERSSEQRSDANRHHGINFDEVYKLGEDTNRAYACMRYIAENMVWTALLATLQDVFPAFHHLDRSKVFLCLGIIREAFGSDKECLKEKVLGPWKKRLIYSLPDVKSYLLEYGITWFPDEGLETYIGLCDGVFFELRLWVVSNYAEIENPDQFNGVVAGKSGEGDDDGTY